MNAIEDNINNITINESVSEKSVEQMLKTEVRHLKEEKKHQIAEILENRNNFEELMLAIPKRLSDMVTEKFTETDEYERKFTPEHVKQIQKAGEHQKRRRLNGEILLDEWGTSGRQRPRIVHLIFCLDKVGLRRASNLLREFVGMEEEYDETIAYESSKSFTESFHQTSNSIAVKVLIDLNVDMTEVVEEASPQIPPSESINITNVKVFTFNEVKEKTNNFNLQKYEGFKSPGRFIGSGGFGKVYVAIDLVEDMKYRFVAVKVMTKIDDKNYKLFFRELKIISNIEHENIVKLLGYSIDVKACLIYEYASGGALKQRLEKSRRAENVYDLKERIKNLWEISKALVYLHDEKGLVHRDIKPENILLDGRIAKLCDFGLTKPQLKGEVTDTRIAGTNLYMAPELQYHEVTHLVDVFAFGLVMLETLTDMKLYDDRRKTDKYLPDYIKNRINDSEKTQEFMSVTVGMPHNSEARLKLIEFSLTCIRYDKTERPPIKFMYEKLLERLGG